MKKKQKLFFPLVIVQETESTLKQVKLPLKKSEFNPMPFPLAQSIAANQLRRTTINSKSGCSPKHVK
jgi:hypothetical protein